jgi:GTP-binding protein
MLVRKFSRGRAVLRCVFILVDSRHGLKETDRDVMGLLDTAAVSYRIVLTKVDEARAGELEKTAAAVRSELTKHPAAYPDVILTSAHKGDGIDVLREAIYRLI